MKIKIDPEFSALIPNSGDDADLEREILADEAIFDPLVVWRHNNILLDGHRRYRIHTRHPTLKMPKPIVLDIESRQEAHNWIIDHQLSKRNVSDEQRRYLLGKRYALNKPAPGKHSVDSSSAKVAEDAGVSPRTVHNAAAKAEAIDAVAAVAGEAVKKAVLDGEVKATTADLKTLAELPTNTAKAVAREIVSGEVKSVGEAIDAVVAPKKVRAKKAKTLKAAVKEEEPELLDSLKSAIPKSLHPIFVEVGEFKSIMSAVSAIKGRVTTLSKSAAAGRLDVQELERLLTQAHSLLRFAMPYTECPKCRRKPEKKCAACFGSGWIHESGYKSTASDADKKWLEAR